MQLVLSYILLFDAIPLILVLGLSSNNKDVERSFLRVKWKYISFFLLITFVVVLISIILQTTFPYIDYGWLYDSISFPKFFHGWVPVYGSFKFLCEHGGFIVTFLLLACLLAINILLPKLSMTYRGYVFADHDLTL